MITLLIHFENPVILCSPVNTGYHKMIADTGTGETVLFLKKNSTAECRPLIC